MHKKFFRAYWLIVALSFFMFLNDTYGSESSLEQELDSFKNKLYKYCIQLHQNHEEDGSFSFKGPINCSYCNIPAIKERYQDRPDDNWIWDLKGDCHVRTAYHNERIWRDAVTSISPAFRTAFRSFNLLAFKDPDAFLLAYPDMLTLARNADAHKPNEAPQQLADVIAANIARKTALEAEEAQLRVDILKAQLAALKVKEESKQG